MTRPDIGPDNGLSHADGAPEFSVIIPCFEEAATLQEFHARLSTALDTLPHTFEIVYVNDGSRDETLEILSAMFEQDIRITRVVDLASNYGQTNAQSAGIEYASGQHFILMDCDLQTDPTDLALLVQAFQSGCDMVSGLRAIRKDALIRRWLSEAGNRLVSRILGMRMQDLGSGLKILRGDLVRAFAISPTNPLDPGASILCLRSVVEVPVSHHPRRQGRSRWTVRRALKLYHNVFMNLVPVMYPFLIAGLMLAAATVLALLLVSIAFPGLLPWAVHPVLPSILITGHMILTLAFLFIVGEFTLRSRPNAKGFAYLVRQVWSRPFAAQREGAASRQEGKTSGRAEPAPVVQS